MMKNLEMMKTNTAASAADHCGSSTAKMAGYCYPDLLNLFLCLQ